MSIDNCANCAAPVDTDFDEDAYMLTLPSGDQIKQEFCRCASCREEAEARLQADSPTLETPRP